MHWDPIRSIPWPVSPEQSIRSISTRRPDNFNLSGGNGNGTANGTDAHAIVNGQTLTGNGNSFQFSDALGLYSFNTVAGFTGAINSINVNSQAGQFNLTGGNGNGTANGTDAHATVNGQTLTGNGNFFQFSDALGSYSFNTVAGFTGAINPINVNSLAGQFDLSGGNGDGTANGTDAVAVINGVQQTGVGNEFNVSDAGGSFQLQFAAGFQGSFDPVTIQSNLAAFNLQGGNGNGLAHGTDFVATINGVNYTNTTNRLTVAGSNGTYDLAFVNGFAGNIQPITITKASNSNANGGESSSSAQGSDAVATINGVEQTGDGSNFTVNENGVRATIQFANGFSGAFDPISMTRVPQDDPNATTSSDWSQQIIASVSQPVSASQSAGYQALKLIQDEINYSYVQNNLDGLLTLAAAISMETRATSAAPQNSSARSGSDHSQVSVSSQYGTGIGKQFTEQTNFAVPSHLGHHVDAQA